MAQIRTYPDLERLSRAAAEHFVDLARQAVADRGRFAVALSGGSTPKSLYALLATEEFLRRVDWPRVHVFWGDERCVPPDHVDSSYRMAKEILLDHVPLPSEQVYRIRGEIEPALAAAEYDSLLHDFFGEVSGPRFDLLLLGMGDDGHTASLFPNTAALNERERWVVENYVEAKHMWRITLSPPTINAAANIAFLVSGAEKAERLRQVLKGDYQPHLLPAQIVKPVNGHLLWFVDEAAAALL